MTIKPNISTNNNIGFDILRIREKDIAFGQRTYVMGIVNITPDSFSNDGIVDIDSAVGFALKQIEKGADVIDIGGQSARPGFTPIDEKTEAERIMPVIAALRKANDVIISVDTFSPLVLEQAIAAGADIANSIWGLTDNLLPLVKKNKMPIVIMHNGTGNNALRNDRNIVNEVAEYLSAQANKALSAGLSREQIILDPGIGFGKTADENLELLTQFKKIKAIGFPTLIGTSRKSTIGKLIDKPVDDRVLGTAATVAFAIAQLVDIVRVHDVAEIVDVVRVSDALVRNWRPPDWVNS